MELSRKVGAAFLGTTYPAFFSKDKLYDDGSPVIKSSQNKKLGTAWSGAGDKVVSDEGPVHRKTEKVKNVIIYLP